MRNAVVLVWSAAALLAIAACGAYRFPGASPSAATATVSGRVLSIPCAPVEQTGTTCAGRPVGGVGMTFTSEQSSHVTVTAPDGTYAIQLAPGTWKVSFKTYMRIVSGPTSINLGAGDNLVANYVLDNGIRAPVPQQ